MTIKKPESDSDSPKTRSLKLKQRLTIPLISMAHLPTLTCRILSEPYVDDKIAVLGKDATSKPTVVRVHNLDTDSEALLVVNTLIASAFERAVPPLTGRIFQLKSAGIRDGKQYRDIDVSEMEEK
jgi:hypothetical protein